MGFFSNRRKKKAVAEAAELLEKIRKRREKALREIKRSTPPTQRGGYGVRYDPISQAYVFCAHNDYGYGDTRSSD